MGGGKNRKNAPMHAKSLSIKLKNGNLALGLGIDSLVNNLTL